MHKKKTRRGYKMNPSRPDPSAEDRQFVVRLVPDGGYYSREHLWTQVPKAKATWLTREQADSVRHHMAKERVGFREASVEER